MTLEEDKKKSRRPLNNISLIYSKLVLCHSGSCQTLKTCKKLKEVKPS